MSLSTVASAQGLGYFCQLRQDAWRAHEARPDRRSSPDPVLAHNHFTNVVRTQDPGTQLVARMLAEHALGTRPLVYSDLDHQHEALWLAVAYRLTNRRETWYAYHAENGRRWPTMDDEQGWLDWLDVRRHAGARIFTGRHLTVGWDRYVQALQDVRNLEPTWVKWAFSVTPLFTGQLREIHGIGQFFAWQVTADLMMSGHLAPDPSHVLLGPGAKLSLRWLSEARPWAEMFNDAGRRVVGAGNGHLSDQQAHRLIVHLQRDQKAWLPDGWRAARYPELTLVDLEHALCEYGRWGQLHARLARKKVAA